MDARRSRAEPLNPRASRAAVWIACALAAAAAAAAFGFGRLPGEMRDFEVYWTAAVRASAGEPLYRAADGHYQFKYLPAFALLMMPVAWLPLPDAKAAWFVASVVWLVALIALSIRILPAPRRPPWLLALVTVIVMGKFYGHELVLGQVNLLFAVLVSAGVLMLRGGRDTAAALLFVAAVAVKPYAVLFLPWILLTRGRRPLPAVMAGMALLVALPVVLYGVAGTIELHGQWWLTVTGSTAPNLTNSDNVSVAGLFAKWLGVGARTRIATLVVSVVLLASAAWVIARRRAVGHPEALEGALLLTLIPLLSPQGWDYVFLVATPAIALFANYDDRVPTALRGLTWTAAAIIGLSLFDLMGRQRYATFMAWSVLTLCFIVIIAALVSLRRRAVA